VAISAAGSPSASESTPLSIETGASWVAAGVVLFIFTFSYGAPLLAVVALKPIAADLGSARADFPGGDARQLYASMRRLLALPPETVVYVCHDYPPATRAPAWKTTVAEQRASNIHVRDGIDEEGFVAMRTARDATLEVPSLILPSIQVNIRAGHFPPADDNGVAYLRIPLNALPLHSTPSGG